MAQSSRHTRTPSSQLPSETSSDTLASRSSASPTNNGWGSARGDLQSSQDRRDHERRKRSRSRNGLGSRAPTNMPEDNEEDGSRRHKPRRTAGFLLESTFLPRKRSSKTKTSPPRVTTPKEKERERASQDSKSSPRSLRSNNKPVESSPLSQVVPQTDEDAYHDRSGASHNGPFHGNGSADAGAHRGSYTSDGPRPSDPVDPAPTVATINPAEIVHLALNLSENRRRNVSGDHSMRAVSGVSSQGGVSYHASLHPGHGGNSRNHSQQHRRTSRNMSPGMGRSSGHALRHSTESRASPLSEPAVILQQTSNTDFQPSASTVARAEKARRHIELSLEYRRLLQYLPPLTDSSGEFSHNSSQSGRMYNSLQAIRNRKSRLRERRPLNPDPDEFEDVAKVRDWLSASDDAFHSRHDIGGPTTLPPYGKHDPTIVEDLFSPTTSPRKEGNAMRGRRQRNDWMITPMELLADAFWTVQPGNQSLMEDRTGNKIFGKPTIVSNGARKGLIGGEKTGRMPSDPEPIVGKIASDDQLEPNGRGRKRYPGNGSSSKAGSQSRFTRRGWPHSRARSTSSSSLSSTDDEAASRYPLSEVEDNTGPLEQAMNKMVADGADGEGQTPSTPNTPERWGKSIVPNQRHTDPHSAASGRSDEKQPNFLANVDQGSPVQRRLKQLPRRHDESHETRSSFEDADSSVPNSPVLRGLMPSISMDLSRPGSRRQSFSRGTKRNKFSLFRSDIRDQRNLEEETDLDEDSNKLSRQPTDHTLSLMSPVTDVVKKISHKANDSVGSFSEIGFPGFKREQKEGNENASGFNVAKFFKGHRLGEIARSEGTKAGDVTARKDSRSEDTDNSSGTYTDDSDLESERGKLSKTSTNLQRQMAGAPNAAGPDDERGRARTYTLPTFLSTAEAAAASRSGENDTKATEGPPPRGNRRRRFGRFGSLNANVIYQSTPSSPTRSPLKSREMQIRDETNHGRSRSLALSPSRSRSGTRDASDRLAAILDVPGKAGRGGLPVTGLTGYKASANASSRPSLRNSRQWSIGDQSPLPTSMRKDSTVPTLSRSDIIRTRALLLSTGIKARELYRRTSEVHFPSSFLVSLADTASKTCCSTPKVALSYDPLQRNHEHLVASDLMARALDSRAAALRKALDDFQHSTSAPLMEHLSKLGKSLDSELIPRVDMCGEEADKIAADVGGELRLRGKQLSDRVDLIMRARRRRTRWIRRSGWILLEWVLLGLMWCVWFVVVIVRLGIGTALGVGRVVRWFFWL